MPSTEPIQLPPLTKRSVAMLRAKAKRLGIAPGDYAKMLIEDGLWIAREAERSSFAEMMAPVREAAGDVDEAEIQKLVEVARTEFHAIGRKKKR